VVTLATRTSGQRTAFTPEAKTATVMLGENLPLRQLQPAV
jgi:hypothetical protein